MASKISPGSSFSDHSEKKALLAQPETSETSDYGTCTEARTELTTTSYDPASPAESSSEAESGQSGSSIPKDESRSGSLDAAGELPDLTSGSAATGRNESEECSAATENVLSASTDRPRDSPPSETRAAEVYGRISHGNPIVQCWQTYSISAFDITFMLPFQVLLIAASISAIVIGSIYVHDCPMATELPFMIITLGSFGVVAVTLRVVLVVCFYDSHTLTLLGKIRAYIIFANLFVITYAVEMWTFFSNTASFNANDDAYCNPVFHTFTTILNSSLFLVLLILFILDFRAYVYNHSNVGGPGSQIAESQWFYNF